MEMPSVLAKGLDSLHLADVTSKVPSDNAVVEAAVDSKLTEIEGSDTVTFNPPVYLQRYAAVQEILKTMFSEPFNLDLENGRTVMEVGCAEYGMHIFLKNILELGKIIYLDIDEKLLTDRKANLRPFPAEYLQRPTRPKPLVIEAYAGDITYVDTRIVQENPEVWGVIAIELIEHLHPEVLRGFEISVFGVINPEIVVVTTPNSDFNVVFNLPPGKFRHWDHKFEWTRNEFKTWCDKICTEFPEYDYSVHGVGEGPLPDTAPLGCVSQMAVFTRNSRVPQRTNQILPSKDNAYKLIESVIFPNYIEKRTLEQIVVDDVDYLICHCWLTKRNIENYMENDIYEVIYTMKEIKDLLPTKSTNVQSVDEEFIKTALMNANKYEICIIDGSSCIRIAIPLWDQCEQDEMDEEEMHDVEESKISINQQDSSSARDIDAYDSWE